MGDKYAVDNESAGQVATDTETAITDLAGVKTSINGPLADAEGGLPPEFANALAWLKTLRENHDRDIDRVTSYTTSCVGALRTCLGVYENSSAEMVAEQKATEAKVVFEHGTAFTNSEGTLNDWANGKGATPGEDRGLATVNENLPSTTEGTTSEHGYEQTTSNDGTTATHTSHSSTGKGYSTSAETYTAAHTRNGATDTTTYYNSTSTRGESETRVATQNYTVEAAR